MIGTKLRDISGSRVAVQIFHFSEKPTMADKRIATQHHATFENIRHVDGQGNEFWRACDLARVLDYSEYRHFLPVIERARDACKNSVQRVQDHFEDILEMVEIGSGAKRELADVRLSRYACYLIVQNGDPAKPVVANGQTYFAMQTRRQELADDAQFATLSEEDKRLAIRNELAAHNIYLAAAAKMAGVETSLDYAIFQDHGYRGLYGGLTNKDIHGRKGLQKSQKVLDHMGSTELAANMFRATQTEEKLKREEEVGKEENLTMPKVNLERLFYWRGVPATLRQRGAPALESTQHRRLDAA